jgi:thioredoxin:protein disulfide reductase
VNIRLANACTVKTLFSEKRFAVGCLLLALALTAQTVSSQMPSGKEVVTPSAYASAEPAARNIPFQLAVVLKIRPGFHINAREKSESYLIATDLKADLPAGFTAGEVTYPKGTLRNFAFSKDKPLNVYEGTATLRLPITPTSQAPLGEQHLALKVRYQACSNEVCLPPVTLPIDAVVNLAASGAKPAHTDIFAPR